ncbi:hypothetical protein [Actinocrispum wychmicini]|uniref:Uncharacterized protein n=1 Tax=Actinocrispum wychmicini TaxID=1213861 RepID=A0A4R2JDB9_9PSEU|nr:hypothetical protein [Actinocrispum wychmicini]TCO54826.1 hypothetical protein EV192_108114 [Actinocrispum wychmicini]
MSRRFAGMVGIVAAVLVSATAPVSAAGWTQVAVPPPAGNNIILNSVDIRTNTDAWAAGTAFATAGGSTFLPIYHWNGVSWSLLPTPPVSTVGALKSVNASSATDAWAVGFTGTSSRVTNGVGLHWDGTAWTSPANTGAVAKLNGVADLSATNAWAVGVQGRFSPAAVQHWDGTTWSSVTIPHPTPQGSGQGESLVAVSARTASDIWAIGSFSPETGPSQTFALHYDGTTWSLVPMPSSGDPQTTFVLNSVAAVGANDVWAVGQRVAAGGTPVATLVEHWDGTQWTVVPSPSIGVFPHLNGVSARAANDVWAVGYSPTAIGGQEQNAALHWDGTAWTVSSTPMVTDFSQLWSVSAKPGTAVWAVGVSRNGPLALTHP